MRSRSVYGVLPLDERSCRSARGRSAKVRKITDSTLLIGYLRPLYIRFDHNAFVASFVLHFMQ